MTESQSMDWLIFMGYNQLTLTELLMNLHESIKEECTSEICVLLTKLTILSKLFTYYDVWCIQKKLK